MDIGHYRQAMFINVLTLYRLRPLLLHCIMTEIDSQNSSPVVAIVLI